MFVVCTKCRRHYRRHEPHCPFCGAVKQEGSNRLGVGLAVAIGVATSLGCSGEENGPVVGTGGTVATGGMGLVAYGPPPVGGSTQGGASNTGGTHASTTTSPGSGGAAIYAAPPTGGHATGGKSSTLASAIPAYAPAPAPPVNMQPPPKI